MRPWPLPVRLRWTLCGFCDIMFRSFSICTFDTLGVIAPRKGASWGLLDNRCINFLAWAALLAIFAFFLAHNLHRIEQQNHLSDFRTFYAAADALAHGNSPYHTDTPWNYVYPPLIAWLLVPLLPLGPVKAAVVFLGANIVLAVSAVLLLAREFQARFRLETVEGSPPVPFIYPALLATLITLGRFKAEIQQNETDTLILAALVCGVCLLDEWPLLAGAALGFAFNIKYLTIGLLPYLLLRRRWRASLSFVCSIILFALLPAITIGMRTNWHYLEYTTGGLLKAVGVDTVVSAEGRVTVVKPSSLISVSLSSGIARQLRGHSGAVLPVLGALARARILPLWKWPRTSLQRAAPYRGLIVVEWSGIMVVTLIFSPNTNTRHLVLALIPGMLLATLFCSARRDIRRTPLIIAGFLCFLGFEAFSRAASAKLMLWWFSIAGPAWCLLLAFAIALPAALRAVEEPPPEARR